MVNGNDLWFCYLTAAKNGTLTYQRSLADKPIPLCESGIDPLCLDLIDEHLRLILRDMKKIIDEQLARDKAGMIKYHLAPSLLFSPFRSV